MRPTLRPVSERGSILVPVLFLLVVSAVLVPVILLSVNTNLRIARTPLPDAAGPNQTPALQAESADAALVSGLELMRDPTSLCGEQATSPLGRNPDGGFRTFGYGGFKFMLACEALTPTGPPVYPPTDGQPAVVLVGNKYNAYKGISKKDWQGDLGGSYGNPWSTALGAAINIDGGTLGDNGQFVYFGKAPLVVGGGVQVKRSISAVNTQPLNAPGGTPAMQAAGPIVQGGPGFTSLASNFPEGSPNRCGVLEPNDQLGKAAVDVVAGSGGSAAPMECGSATIAGRAETAPGVTADTAFPWTNENIAKFKKPILDKGGNPTTDCGSYSGRKDPAANTGDLPLIELEGAFGPAETKILNEWFRTCRATWQFVGNTYFDVYDPTQTDARQHSLVLDLYESNYVVGSFGSFPDEKPLPMKAFPNACDRNSPPTNNGEVQTRGATITLSSRTGLRHNNGRVAICGPKQSGNTFHKTAIYQQRATDLTNWSPEEQLLALDAAGSCSTCVPFTQNGNTFQAAGSGTAGTGTFAAAIATVRFNALDSGMVDGHLPLDLASFKAKLTVSGLSNNLFTATPAQNGSTFQVKFRFPRPRYRLISAGSGRTPDFLECWSEPQQLTAGEKIVSLGGSGSSCLYRNADGTTQGAPTEVAIGEAVKYVGRCNEGPPRSPAIGASGPIDSDVGDTDVCSPRLDVVVRLIRNSIQTGSLSASISKPELSGSTIPEFTTPRGPLSVRWAPRELNNDGTNKPGDAMFNVFGSVVMPYNAVEVRWGPRGRATGTPIFNGGEVPQQNCSYSNSGGCRPAIVAGALASWTTQGDASEGRFETAEPPNTPGVVADDTVASWPEGEGGVPLQPDLLATNSDGRPSQRTYRLTACLVVNDKGTATTKDDEVYPRSWVNAFTRDLQSGLKIYGRPSEIFASGVINQDSLQLYQAGNWDETRTDEPPRHCRRPPEFVGPNPPT